MNTIPVSVASLVWLGIGCLTGGAILGYGIRIIVESWQDKPEAQGERTRDLTRVITK